MPEKCERSGSTFRLTPWKVTQRRTRMPIAAILSSAPSPLSGRRTQTPTRSSRRSPRMLNAARRGDQPCLESGHVAAQVRRPAVEVEHHIGHPLAGAVIGELPAPARPVDREAVGLDEVLGLAPRCRPCRAADARRARRARPPARRRWPRPALPCRRPPPRRPSDPPRRPTRPAPGRGVGRRVRCEAGRGRGQGSGTRTRLADARVDSRDRASRLSIATRSRERPPRRPIAVGVRAVPRAGLVPSGTICFTAGSVLRPWRNW